MANTIWDKWYWGDWANDPGLKLCSFAAQGLWMRMLCIAAEAEHKGYVAVAGQPCGAGDLAQLVGKPIEQVEPLLDELEGRHVFSRTRTGEIYNRRMVRDEKKKRIARDNGKLGGNPNLSKQREIPPSDNPQPNPPSGSNHLPDTRKKESSPVGEPKKEPADTLGIPDFLKRQRQPTSPPTTKATKLAGAMTRKTQIPEAWKQAMPAEQLEAALTSGLDPPAAHEEFEGFALSAETHGRLYKSWPAAWRMWLKNMDKFDGNRSRTTKPKPLDGYLAYAERCAREDAPAAASDPPMAEPADQRLAGALLPAGHEPEG